jgi:hypothetical protein
MTMIGYNMFNTHPKWSPSSTNESTSSFLRYKGAGGPGGEKGELAGTNRQRPETQNDGYEMYQIHTVYRLQATLPDETTHC